MQSTMLQASIPSSDIASASTAQVTVVTPAPGGGASNAAVFSVLSDVPKITSLSPASATVGAPGQTVLITGTGFIPTFFVFVNGPERASTYVSPTQLRVNLWATDFAQAGVYRLVVTNWTASGGKSSNLAGFQVVGTQPPPPPQPPQPPQNAPTFGSI